MTRQSELSVTLLTRGRVMSLMLAAAVLHKAGAVNYRLTPPVTSHPHSPRCCWSITFLQQIPGACTKYLSEVYYFYITSRSA